MYPEDHFLAEYRSPPDCFFDVYTALACGHAMVNPWTSACVHSFALTKSTTVRNLVYMSFVFLPVRLWDTLPVYLWDTLCFFQCIYGIVSCWMWKQNGKCIFFSVLPSLRGKGGSWELVRGLDSIQVWENGHWMRMRRGWWGVGRGLRLLKSAQLLNRFWT